MPKRKMTFSLSEDLARFLRGTPNASATVAEAVGEYRARRLEEELEAAYREGAAESERLAEEWAATDDEISDD